MMRIQKTFNKFWTDWAKFGAAILVAISHYSTCVCINNHWSDSVFLRLMCQGGNLGVALFFFLSGYGLMESESKRHLGLKDFVKKRFTKIYLPVLLVSFFWIPTCLISAQYHPASLGIVIYDILWGFKDSVLWFVKILFALYGLFYVYTEIRVLGRETLSLIILMVGSLLIMWIAIGVGWPYINIPLFSIGVVASEFKDKSLFKIPFYIWLLLLTSVVCSLMFLITSDAHVAHGIINCAFVFIVLIFTQLPPPIQIHLQKNIRL